MKQSYTYSKKRKYNSKFFWQLLVAAFLFLTLNLNAQDFMMQGWYWDYPKPDCNGYNGPSLAAEMAAKAAAQKEAGFTMMWMPPMTNASFG
jgi:hypothetical protein